VLSLLPAPLPLPLALLPAPTPPTPPTLPPVCDGQPVPVRPVQQQLCAGNCPCRALSCFGPKWLHVNTILSGGVVRQTPTQQRAIQKTQTATHTRTHTNVRVHTHLQILTRGAHTHLHISPHTHTVRVHTHTHTYKHTTNHAIYTPFTASPTTRLLFCHCHDHQVSATALNRSGSGSLRAVRRRKRPQYLFHL
jgi:hypothetical protein